ncbi:MAG: response regulator transcription factor [Bacteroidales bacterium]|nr:response regulator transcription factor [Bacteroidales bacterium]
MIKAIIIDDEEEGRSTLKNILNHFCKNVEVTAEAESVKTGLVAVQDHPCDVLFLDIQLQDGTGFDILEKTDRCDFKTIFVTAYDHYAIKAFKFSAFDYLLKPIDPEQLISAIEKFESGTKQEKPFDEVRMLLENKQKIKNIALPSFDGIRFIKISRIIRCQSESNYTRFYLDSGENILVTNTLKEYDEMLSAMNFCRVHQSHLINLDHVERYLKGDGGAVVLSDGSEVEVSRRKKDEFLKKMVNSPG